MTTMYVRFHKGQYVDAVIPSAVGVQPSAAPGDVVWELPSDINPSKTITVTQNVQAVDPLTGQPLFNTDGTPKWKTTNALDAQGNPIPVIDPATGKPEVDANGKPVYQQVIVTQQVPKIVYLLTNPTEFTPTDFQGIQYTVVGSLDEAKAQKLAEIGQAYQKALNGGFAVAIGGTTYTFGWTTKDETDMNALQKAIDKAFVTFPVEYADINGNPVAVPDQATLDTIEHTAATWAMSQHQQALTLAGQVNAATSTIAVQAIHWS